jgi:hypothetical protein
MRLRRCIYGKISRCRHCEPKAKQSRPQFSPAPALDCFVAALLAMTGQKQAIVYPALRISTWRLDPSPSPLLASRCILLE